MRGRKPQRFGKIDSEGEESRSNVTNCEIRAVTHFDNNVENVLTSIAELKEKVIKPKKLDNMNELLKLTQEMLKLICVGTATTTLQQSFKEARQFVYDNHLKTNWKRTQFKKRY